MPYFFSDKNLSVGLVVELAGQEARHILLAHRAKKGEKIKLQGPDGKRFLAEIISATKSSLSAKALDEIQIPAEPLVSVTLLQSAVNEKALDFIFQKGTELGLNKIVLFNSQNTALKLSRQVFEKKQERWEKILQEAAKQSGRSGWPEIEFVGGFEEALEQAKSFKKNYLADPEAEKLKSIPSGTQNVAYIIGPEGGFSSEEISRFKNLPGLQAFSLGPILLRAETAAIAALAVLRNLLY